MLGIFALGLWILVSIQEVSCTEASNPKPDTLPISLVSTSLGLNSTPSTTLTPSTTPGIFKEYIFRSPKTNRPRLYIDVWNYLHASDDEIADLEVEKVSLTNLKKIELAVEDGKLVAKRIKKEKEPGNKIKQVEEVVTVRNLAKKNSHTKTLCLRYIRNCVIMPKDLLQARFGEEVKMERLRLLLSLAHHYFDSLEVIYLSFFQGASMELKAIFKERNIKIEGGMPTLKTLFVGNEKPESEGYVSDSYLAAPVLIKTKYVLKSENFNLSSDEASKAIALGCSDSQHSAAALTLNVETIRQKLDSAKCELCDSPFKDQETGKYSKRIFITKCHKLFHYDCLHLHSQKHIVAEEYKEEICCNSCDIFIRTRGIYHEVVKNKDANEGMNYNLVLMKFCWVICAKEVKFDKRPNYTIQIFLGPVVPSNAITESPAIGSENPIKQEAETSS